LAKPNKLLNKWEYYRVTKHDFLDVPETEIAKTLFQKICSEIQLYIGDKKRIGVLLSGGMDSRMIAGSLDYLMKTNNLISLEVTGLTWGNEETRDVVYAKEIAARLNWSWKHYKVTAKDLLNNIKETAIHGCEYSPIHLHAIPQIRDDNNLDVILAGSYGDSVGRAEYSGRKVRFIKPLLQNISNIGGIVHQKDFDHSMKYIENDIDRYHVQFPEKMQYMQNELDYQIHYMRRMLNPCMELLTEKMEFYQVFTHPDVYGYIWSLNPERRNNLVYRYMFQEFITKLSDIPWARTGLQYGSKKGTPDLYHKDHHSYLSLIQKEIFNEIETLVLSNEIKQLGIFNRGAIKTLIKLIKYFPPNNLVYLEKIVWLASLAEMTRIYKLQGMESAKSDQYKSNKSFSSVVFEYFFEQTKKIVKSVLNK
jgi:asparagine synthase (glutamine-hydrolysing)